MAQGDYQALAKLAAEEPRLARLKVRSVLLYVSVHLFIYISAPAESEIRRGTSQTSRAFEAATRIRYYTPGVSGTRSSFRSVALTGASRERLSRPSFSRGYAQIYADKFILSCLLLGIRLFSRENETAPRT